MHRCTGIGGPWSPGCLWVSGRPGGGPGGAAGGPGGPADDPGGPGGFPLGRWIRFENASGVFTIFV